MNKAAIKLMTMILIVLFVVNSVNSFGCDVCPRICTGEDYTCRGCDPLGEITCSNFAEKLYNNLVIVNDCIPDPESNLTCSKDDTAVCYIQYDCVEGEWLSWKKCISMTSGSGCSESSSLLWCQTCKKTNRYDDMVYDWICE